jgi:hypothetical protein
VEQQTQKDGDKEEKHEEERVEENAKSGWDESKKKL